MVQCVVPIYQIIIIVKTSGKRILSVKIYSLRNATPVRFFFPKRYIRFRDIEKVKLPESPTQYPIS